MRALCAALGDPQTKFPSVLIAGTNGKGSTAATLASILDAAGNRTALYTSPHLVRVNERIRIFSGEVEEGYRGKDLEEAGGMREVGGFDEAAGGFVDLEVKAGEVFVWDLYAVDLDALVNPEEMRRGVETRAVASGGKDAGEGCGGRAFAVGSGDEH